MAKNWHCKDCNKLIWNRYTRCHSCAKKGSLNSNFNKGMSGNRNPNWQGGIAKNKYTYIFKKRLSKEVISNMPKCQLCKSKNDLVTHHIDFDKQNNHLSNLITLCRSCNAKVNFNREYNRILLRYKLEKRMIYT